MATDAYRDPAAVQTVPPPRDGVSGGDGLDGTQLYALRELARDATLSQRDLAGRLGLSLGRVNYVVNSLIRKGLVKARRFKNARNKLAYRYVLTPEGLHEKVVVTRHFLQAKLREYERLQREIEVLRRETAAEGEEGGGG
jgi:EPS-associated MarR family transcriptional regulator